MTIHRILQRQELSKTEGVTTSSQITNAGFNSSNDNVYDSIA